MTTEPLKPAQLRRRCDAAALGFEDTSELTPVDGLIGQKRALDALEFGTGLGAPGYNIFVLGAPGSGRHNAVKRFLTDKAKTQPAPSDWVYVHNFDEAHRPQALELPPGRGPVFEDMLEALIETLRTAMPAVFEGEDYQDRRAAIENAFKEEQQEALEALSQKAQSQGLGLARTPQGFAVVPIENGEPAPPETLSQMDPEARQALEAKIKAMQDEVQDIALSIPRRDKERREQVRALNRRLAEVAVDRAMDELYTAFGDLEPVKAHLDRIQDHLAEHAVLFVRAAQQSEGADGAEAASGAPLDRAMNRYKANALRTPSQAASEDHAPVVYLDSPGLGHLLGRIEHMPHMGAMLTDFTLIKPGALHDANGGYLIVDAERLLAAPGSWEALKRRLRAGSIAIEPPTTGWNTTTAVTLEPEPIPLDVKIALIGQRGTFYLLQQMDVDFTELFKVAADFDEVIEWSDDHVREFCRLLGSMARREQTAPLTAEACAAVIERAARLSDDRERLSLRVGALADLVREADHWRRAAGDARIERAHVERAVDEQINRLDRIRERMHEQITRDTVLIDTTGAAVGQINGLSVLKIGAFTFGKPTRITARARMGAGQLVDIEREVELGGALHSKGVLILSGFLAARYAHDAPISLAASLVFEQSYGGVDGDSASSTELYALLSALSGLPIRQGLAVTGSVSQNGEVQAIGGVNEKIEGFFEICRARGLSGEQGVLIPAANVKNLMLREDVVAACRDGRFAVHAVSHVDEGIELLTGRPAGERGADGQFPAHSVNRLVEDALRRFAEARRAYLSGPERRV